jgi:predicted DNA-binding WGR domain protein
VRYGTFEVKTKSFEDPAKAAAEAETRIAEKLARGFKERPE